MPSAPELERPGREDGQTDHHLVSAVRRGDDRAFEVLYTRYQRRIAAYCFGMVKDYGRAEDITQEVFVSALRRMRKTERPIAFKPWVYEIAKNACIDAYRRGRRAEEISIDADDRLSAADHGRLAATAPDPESAVDAKQELDLLCGAFGGLTETHHEILVMREFEGRSYKDIGERMGMSRPAVESTLFRARKRLGEEYDELASGARCLRIQGIIAEAGHADLGVRDQRRLARHVSHCQPCRRLAAECGVEVPLPLRTRVAGKLAAWLPFPFLRTWAAQAPAVTDGMGSGWGKAAAGLAALLVAGAGAGVTTTLQRDGSGPRDPGARPAAAQPVVRDAPAAAAPRSPRAQGGERVNAGARRQAVVGKAGGKGKRSAGGAQRRGGTPGETPDATPRTPVPATGGDGTTAPSGGEAPSSGGGKSGGRTQGGGQGSSLPAATRPVTDAVDETLAGAGQTVQHAGENVGTTVDNAAQNVNNTLQDPGNLVPNVTDTANDVVNDAGTTVGDAVDDLGDTVGGLLRP